jgi:phosphatidylserine/phosphatidylglycerophosphate/cardiolipin synthase-like enzyme
MSTGKNDNSSYALRGKIQLIKSSSQNFNLLKGLIEKAKLSFYMRICICEDDTTGTLIAG